MDNGGAFTDRLFAEAKIPQGSTALDIGCGGGDITFRLSSAVGAQGRVTGLDLNGTAIEHARKRASALDVTNTQFLERDFLEFAQSGAKFDLTTCRRVLMYLADQSKAAKAFFNLLKPNGILLLQEHDKTIRLPAPDRPLADRAQRWIWDTVKFEGANLGTGFQLQSLLSDAGFREIAISAEAVVETPSQAVKTAEMVRHMLPRIEAAKVATAEEIDLATLEERLAIEQANSKSTSITEIVFGAIARVV